MNIKTLRDEEAGSDFELENGNGKRSRKSSWSSIDDLECCVKQEPGPYTQHRTNLINEVKSKLNKNMCNQTENGQQFDLKTKLALVNKIMEINVCKKISYRMAIKKLDWSKCEIGGHSSENLQECLTEILASINSTRTLEEMLNDYLKNYHRYERKKQADLPKRPFNPCLQYLTDHREEFEKKLMKKTKTKPKFVSLESFFQSSFSMNFHF